MFDGMPLKGLALVVVLGFTVWPAASTTREAPPPADKPNILFILTDDLDARSTSRMPALQEQLAARGTTFDQAFATAPQCCPSRASFLTGKYPHNHTVYDNDETLGGARKFRSSGEDESTIATWLDAQGYETILMGKYLNGYDGTYIPPGWDEWRGQMESNNNHLYNEDGQLVYYDPDTYHDTDMFSDWAVSYIENGAGKNRPFFMYLSVNAPHHPAIPAERHKDEFSTVELPQPPSFDEEDVSDKPQRVRNLPTLTDAEIQDMTRSYRDRLRSMLSVDDMIGRLVAELHESGELDETYIVFTSDHGYHMGQHRLRPGKARAYEEDIRIPLYVRGPGVPEGRTLEHKVLNLDFAPTFAELGRAPVPTSVDGRSFVPLLHGSTPAADAWRESFMVEFYRQSATSPLNSDAFSALRTSDYTYVEHANGDRELYDLEVDPYQLLSLHDSSEHRSLMAALHVRLEALKACSGQVSCKVAEGGEPIPPPVSSEEP